MILYGNMADGRYAVVAPNGAVMATSDNHHWMEIFVRGMREYRIVDRNR